MKSSLGKWKQILVQSAKDFFHDSGPEWAASIAYYSLLSLFPLLLAALGIAAFFVSPTTAINDGVRVLGEVLPGGEADIARVVSEAYKARGGISIISIIILVWTGMQVFGTVMKAINIANTTGENYTFLRRMEVQIAMTITLGVLFLLAFGLSLLINTLFSPYGKLPLGQALLQLSLEFANGLLFLLAFTFTYRYVPRCTVRWPSAFAGGATATLLLLSARPVFIGYDTYFARFNLVYGSLAIVVTLVIWAWIMAMILIFGGEIAAHVQAIAFEDRPAHAVEERHIRRSPIYKDVEGVTLPPKENVNRQQ